MVLVVPVFVLPKQKSLFSQWKIYPDILDLAPQYTHNKNSPSLHYLKAQWYSGTNGIVTVNTI